MIVLAQRSQRRIELGRQQQDEERLSERWRGAERLVRPDGIVARPGLVPSSLAVPVEVA